MTSIQPASSAVDRGSRLDLVAILTFFCACFSFIGAQRFTLGFFSAHICAAPFLLALIYWRQESFRSTLLVLAVFLSVDNGAGLYVETVWPLRYALYLSLIISTFSGYRLSIRQYLATSILLLVPLLTMAFDTFGLSMNTFLRDMQIAFLVLLVLSRSKKSKPIRLEIGVLVISLIAFLVAELLNAALFFRVSEFQYLNFDSTKSLIVMPVFYFIYRRNLKIVSVLFIATSLVIFAYGTRMLTLAYLLTSIPFMILSLNFRERGFGKFIVLLVVAGMLFSLLISLMSSFSGFKAISFLFFTDISNGISTTLKLLDPVRYFEHVMFFDRNILTVLVGSGYGSGLPALNNELYFVSPGATAFSAYELSTDIYYNLHDTWIDIGVRFGFAFVILMYINTLYRGFRISNSASHLWLLTSVLLTCASFSSSGVVLIYFFWQVASSVGCGLRPHAVGA